MYFLTSTNVWQGFDPEPNSDLQNQNYSDLRNLYLRKIYIGNLFLDIFFVEFGAWCIKIKQTSKKQSKKYRKLKKCTEGDTLNF